MRWFLFIVIFTFFYWRSSRAFQEEELQPGPYDGEDDRGAEDHEIDYERINELLAADSDEADVEELKDVIYKLIIKQSVVDAPPAVDVAIDPMTGLPIAVSSEIGVDPNAPPAPPPAPCSSHLGCDPCIKSGCAWCIGARACKEDIPWQCQGDVDHISYCGVGKHLSCPSPEELAERRREREVRKGGLTIAAESPRQGTNTKTEAEAEVVGSGADSDTDDDSDSSSATASASTGSSKYNSATKEQHLTELTRRAALAQSVTSGAVYGALHPYDTLGLEPTASGGEIRKVYRRLSLLYHPDKNPDSSTQALATLAFKDIVAAFEVLGNPEKRAYYDDLGDEAPESFNSEAAYERWGKKNENNFYQGHPYITPLSEATWETRVGRGNQLWFVQFYAPWCGHCQQNIANVKKLAELLKDDEDVEVGAVNCVTETRICSEWYAVRAYPTFLAVNDLHGTRQEYQDGIYEPELLAEWVRKIAREWRYLISRSTLHTITSPAQFHQVVVNTTDFVVVAFMDGFECSSCKTARTNAMRLSASLRGYKGVAVAVVDCDSVAMEGVCSLQQLPSPPYAPVVKGYPSGNKSVVVADSDESSGSGSGSGSGNGSGSGSKVGTVQGKVLYNSNEVEPHIALQMIDGIVRMLLADRIEVAVGNSVGLPGDGTAGYDAEKKDDEKDKEKQRDEGMPPDMQWNGPKRAVGVAWGGDEERILTSPRLGQ